VPWVFLTVLEAPLSTVHVTEQTFFAQHSWRSKPRVKLIEAIEVIIRLDNDFNARMQCHSPHLPKNIVSVRDRLAEDRETI
jgi:hypothetical protein